MDTNTKSTFSIKSYSHGNTFFDKYKDKIYKKALEEMNMEEPALKTNSNNDNNNNNNNNNNSNNNNIKNKNIKPNSAIIMNDEEKFKRLSKKKRRRLMKRAENCIRKEMGEPKRKRVKATMRANKLKAREHEKVDVESCKYINKNGKRCVVPYVHQFVTFTKKRWFNRGIYEVYTSEFNAHPPLYYKSSILAGFITVNGEKCTDLNTKLKNGDKIVHRTHRHEPPV